ncbi:MAG: putative sulfate exporter family transporter [Pirellulales bacterium]
MAKVPDVESSQAPVAEDDPTVIAGPPPTGLRSLIAIEDWWAVWIGGALLIASLAIVWNALPEDFRDTFPARQKADAKYAYSHPLTAKSKDRDAAYSPWIARPGMDAKRDAWTTNPLDSTYRPRDVANDFRGIDLVSGSMIAIALLGILFGTATASMGRSVGKFLPAYIGVACLAALAFVMATQSTLLYYNLEFVIWALVVGLVISNTIGTPEWLKPALCTEFYIKTGLVLYGTDVLFHLLLKMGPAGMFISWISTPVVFLLTYWIGQKWIKLESKSLNLVICADMSVCGVSAAIATGAACKAKKTELTLAIGLSLIFTAVMMVAMPAFINAVEMPPALAGIWLGGTIDATGAVVAAGKLVGETAEKYAFSLKMIQNVLIGVLSFAVAVYWTSRVEKRIDGAKPSLWEIWRRFPKFVLGFLAASAAFTLLSTQVPGGEVVAKSAGEPAKILREWCFCLGFVSIGLETNFREYWPYLRSGKPLALYVIGQLLNLAMTLGMGYLALYHLFPEAATLFK